MAKMRHLVTAEEIRQSLNRLQARISYGMNQYAISKLDAGGDWSMVESIYESVPKLLDKLAQAAEEREISAEPFIKMRSAWTTMRHGRPGIREAMKHFRQFILDAPQFGQDYDIVAERLLLRSNGELPVPTTKPKWSNKKADVRAAEILAQDGWPGSLRKMGKKIGCSHQLIQDLPSCERHITRKTLRPELETKTTENVLEELVYKEDRQAMLKSLTPDDRQKVVDMTPQEQREVVRSWLDNEKDEAAEARHLARKRCRTKA